VLFLIKSEENEDDMIALLTIFPKFIS